jgi:methyltransferase
MSTKVREDLVPSYAAWLTAIVFSIANALVHNVRIRDENAALGYA